MTREATAADYYNKVEVSAKNLKVGNEIILWDDKTAKTYVRTVVKVGVVGSQVYLEFDDGQKGAIHKKRNLFLVKKA